MSKTFKDACIVFVKVSESLGKSRFHEEEPTFALESDEEDYGSYYPEDNEIVIGPKALENEETLLRTVIHEYTHYLQDPVTLSDIQSEIEAYAAEQNWRDYESK